ncbi:MAG: hypothetical protein ACLTQI_05905 [Slackia sp.]
MRPLGASSAEAHDLEELGIDRTRSSKPCRPGGHLTQGLLRPGRAELGFWHRLVEGVKHLSKSYPLCSAGTDAPGHRLQSSL